MRKFLAIFLLGFSSLVTAQTVQTTPNLITSGTNHTWTGVTTGAIPAGCATAGPCPGGPSPIYDPSTNTVSFSYNSNAYVGQTIAINNALASVGAGVKINGYNYGYQVRNMNGDDRQPGTDTFTVATALRGANNSVLLSHNQYFNTKFEWTTYSGTKTATTPIDPANATYLQIGIQGGDNGYWGGYFGPQIRNVNMSLNYTVDPCAANPAYSPSCANYNTVNLSNNLVPNPSGYAYGGYSIDQSYAINQALGLAGSNVMIHGFQWGYIANTNGSYCAAWDMGIFGCWDMRYPTVTTSVNITDNNNISIYSINRSYSNSYNTTNYSYIFPSSRNLATLGRFNFSGTTNDQNAFLGEMWSKALYTPDPCADPLSNPSCPGYAQAYFTQQCTISALYNTACPGYQVAYFTQQCNINQLYNQACPGYAAAYLVQQCTVNPMYSTTCSGYQTAVDECSTNPLSHSYCTNYQTAQTECSVNPLYGSYCPGYTTASSDCSTNPLSHSYCTNYQTATTQCSINPLYASYCPGYQTATTQCSANTLYASYCPGYEFAYQCSLDGLYSKQCPNYAEAYAKKYVLNVSPATTTTTVVVAEATTTTAGTVSNTGTVATTSEAITTQLSSGISDSTVSSVVTTKTTSTSTEASPAAAVKLTAPAGATTTTVTTAAASEKKQDDAKKEEKKDEGSKQNANSTSNSGTSADTKPSNQPKTARQELAERRREAAAKEAVAKGKDLANEMGKAADMEAQKAVQNVVIQAMGFTPGFDTYNKAMIPDSRFYAPKTVYGGQVNVDNKAISRRLMTGSDSKHQDMVESQYNRGN